MIKRLYYKLIYKLFISKKIREKFEEYGFGNPIEVIAYTHKSSLNYAAFRGGYVPINYGDEIVHDYDFTILTDKNEKIKFSEHVVSNEKECKETFSFDC